MKLGHASTLCSSRDKANKFYHAVLDLSLIKEMDIPSELSMKIFGIASDCQLMFFAGDNLAIEVFIPAKEIPKGPSYDHLCLEVKDRKAFLARCREYKVTIREIDKNGSILYFIEDFDGNLFEIKQSC